VEGQRAGGRMTVEETPWLRRLRLRVIARIEHGWSAEAVASTERLHVSTVRRWCGITDTGKRSHTAAVRAEVVRRVGAGETMCKVSLEMDIPHSSMQRWCVDAGAWQRKPRARTGFPKAASGTPVRKALDGAA